MEELGKTLSHFIARDFIYIIGGSAVIISFLYLSDQLDLFLFTRFGTLQSGAQAVSTAFYLLIAGFAYVIGYAIKDGLSVFVPFVRSSHLGSSRSYR